MSHLDEFVPAVTSQSLDDFARAHASLFLLLKLRQEESSEEWRFQTRTVAGVQGGEWSSRLSANASQYRVFALVKMSRNPWPERISVGRARNNDVVLPDGSVSKLHAHFLRSPQGGLLLADAGSRNGTSLNNHKLASGERLPVHVGDAVVIGGMAMTILDAAKLYELVHAQLR